MKMKFVLGQWKIFEIGFLFFSFYTLLK